MDYQIPWITITFMVFLHGAGYVQATGGFVVPRPPGEGAKDAVTSSSISTLATSTIASSQEVASSAAPPLSASPPSSSIPSSTSTSPSVSPSSVSPSSVSPSSVSPSSVLPSSASPSSVSPSSVSPSPTLPSSTSQAVSSPSLGNSPQPTTAISATASSQASSSTSASSVMSSASSSSESPTETLGASPVHSRSPSAATMSPSSSPTANTVSSDASSSSIGTSASSQTVASTASSSVSLSASHASSSSATSGVKQSQVQSSSQSTSAAITSSSQAVGVSASPSPSAATSSVSPTSLATPRTSASQTTSQPSPAVSSHSPSRSMASSSKDKASPSPSSTAASRSQAAGSSSSPIIAPASSSSLIMASSSSSSPIIASSSASPMIPSSSSSSVKAASSSSIAPSPSPSPSPVPDKVFYCRFSVVAVCSSGIKENNPNDAEFTLLRDKVILACKDAFKNDTTFKDASLVRFDCGSVIPQLKITKSGNAPTDANVALKPLSDRVSANTLSNVNVNTQSFSAARTSPPVVEPNIYVIMELLLSNNEFCPNLKDFKNNLAKRVLKEDGTTNISPSQVVVFQNECNNLNAAGTDKGKPRFYIAQDSNINTPDITLTKRAYNLIDQYIKDGTTSRLGAAFDGKVVKVSYGGKDAPEDDKLSDLAIVFIAIGATVGVLLLIILIILLCRGACRSDKPSNGKKAKEVKMTNPIYMDDSPGARDNPSLVLAEEGKKGTNDKIKIDENDYEYPTGPANGSAPRNGVTHVEVNSNNNEGYVDMEPAEYQPLEDIARPVAPAVETEVETPPPDYQELNVVEPEKKEEEPIPKEYIEFTELPSSEEPSESQSPEPIVIIIPEAPVEEVPEEAPLVAEAAPMPEAAPIPEAEEPPKVEVEPEEPPQETVPPAIEVEYSLPPPPAAPESEGEDTASLPSLASMPIGLGELAARKGDDDLLKKEFESIEYSLPDTSIYPPALIEKNRYPSIVPRPETRVVIPALPMTINSDYINANYVRDIEGNKAYIATQGPLQGTANDFWRMIWDKNASVVVMVSPLIHMGMEKCFQYWPPDSISRRYGDIDVQLKKKELRPDFTVTTMTVKQGSDIRELVLYRFMTWPEDAIPENAKSAVTYLLEVRKRAKVTDADPLVVHCSDGVGVTGAFIAIDIGMRSLDQNKTVDIVSLVRSIREDRSGAVQTFDQYRFIYQALYEYAVIIGSSETADALQKAKSNNDNATSKM